MILFASALPLCAQTAVTEPRIAHPDSLFRDREVMLDLFGTLSVGESVIDDFTRERVRDDGRLGAGAGLTFFFMRYVGVSGEAYTENTADEFVDKASGSLVVRYPIESVHLAPYAFGGAGRQFDPEEEWFGQVGAGLEFRITHHCGIFADGRYMIFDDADNDIGLGRVGVRLVF